MVQNNLPTDKNNFCSTNCFNFMWLTVQKIEWQSHFYFLTLVLLFVYKQIVRKSNMLEVQTKKLMNLVRDDVVIVSKHRL